MKLWRSFAAAFLLPILMLLTLKSLAAADSNSATEAYRIAKQLQSLSSKSKIVLLGENSHNLPDSLHFLRDFLQASEDEFAMYDNQLSFIALDLSSEYQADLSAIVIEPKEIATLANAFLDRLEKDNGRKLFSETRQAYLRFFRRLGWSNEQQKAVGQSPIQLVAIDLPADSVEAKKALDSLNISPEGHWFTKRDEYMFRVLQEVSSNFQRRGVVLAGVAHTIKTPFPLPRIAAVTMRLDGELQNLGVRLVEQLGTELVTSVWLDSKTPASERFAFLPPDYTKMFSWVSNLSKVRPSFITTDYPENDNAADAPFVSDFRAKETDFLSSITSHNDITFSLFHSVDYIIKLHSWLGPISRCESFFSAKNWTRGLVMRATSKIPMRDDVGTQDSNSRSD